MTSYPVRGALVVAAFALFAAPSLAQTAPPDGAARHEHRLESMEKHRSAISQDLHTVLHIRPDQEAAFSAFEASMTPTPRPEHRGPPPGGDELTTPQRLDKMLAKLDEHVAKARARIAATKTFYAALSPEQQHVFDALGRMRGAHGPHGGWGEHKGGSWGGPKGGPGEGPPPGE